MTDTTQTALIISVAPTIAAIGAIVIAWLGRNQSKRNAAHITGVHLLINSRMDELLKAARSESHAAGMAEGRQAGADETHSRVIESERVEDREAERKGTK